MGVAARRVLANKQSARNRLLIQGTGQTCAVGSWYWLLVALLVPIAAEAPPAEQQEKGRCKVITVKAEHHYVLTFDGEDVEKLRSLCGVACIALEEHRGETFAFAGQTKEQRDRLRAFIGEIFEGMEA